MDVFLTVDTEISAPLRPNWLAEGLAEEIERDVYGSTAAGEFGIRFLIDRLNAHDLKAVFFVESLFACTTGLEPLRKIVNLLQKRGQDVQLHCHTEWLDRMKDPLLGEKSGQSMRDFDRDGQTLLIGRGIRNLCESGAKQPCAFRAGNFGADSNTLQALRENGIRYDSSYNVCYLRSECGLITDSVLIQPQELGGVLEFPISFFQDGPRHYRPAQLCACSSAELEAALFSAWRWGWRTFVIVLHSFELIKRPKDAGVRPKPARITIRRFERLCRFLARHPDKFVTRTFGELSLEPLPATSPRRPLSSGLHRTAWRYLEQIAGRLL